MSSQLPPLFLGDSMENNSILYSNKIRMIREDKEREEKAAIAGYITDKTGFKVTIYGSILNVGCTLGQPNYLIHLKNLTFENINEQCEKVKEYFKTYKRQ